MSWDLQSLSRPCGHEQRLERYTVDPFDFRTLRYVGQTEFNMRASITNSSQVEVFLGGNLVPSSLYRIVPDPDRVQQNYSFQKIMFNQPMRLVRPLIEVNYITRQGQCLQCNGNGYVNDWAASHSGALLHVIDLAKLAQRCLKYILTSKNPFTPTLICHLKDYIGKNFGLEVTSADITSAIQSALETMMQIQIAQKTVQTVSNEETLKDILSIDAQQDPNNPILIYVSVVVAGYGSSAPIPLNIALQAAPA